MSTLSRRNPRRVYDAGTALGRVFLLTSIPNLAASSSSSPSAPPLGAFFSISATAAASPRARLAARRPSSFLPAVRRPREQQQQQCRAYAMVRRPAPGGGGGGGGGRHPGAKLAQGRMPRDEEIKYRLVQVRDEETGKLSEPVPTAHIMAELDRRLHSLVVVALPTSSPSYRQQKQQQQQGEGEEADAAEAGGKKPAARAAGLSYPICRIVDRKAELAAHQERARAERRKAVQTKELEINWAIAPHDLQHRLRQLRQFLSRGLRVDILLLSKGHRRAAGGKKKTASQDEARETLRLVKEVIDAVPGVREAKPTDGKIGANMRIYIEGPAGGVPAEPGAEPGAADAEAT